MIIKWHLLSKIAKIAKKAILGIYNIFQYFPSWFKVVISSKNDQYGSMFWLNPHAISISAREISYSKRPLINTRKSHSHPKAMMRGTGLVYGNGSRILSIFSPNQANG